MDVYQTARILQAQMPHTFGRDSLTELGLSFTRGPHSAIEGFIRYGVGYTHDALHMIGSGIHLTERIIDQYGLNKQQEEACREIILQQEDTRTDILKEQAAERHRLAQKQREEIQLIAQNQSAEAREMSAKTPQEQQTMAARHANERTSKIDAQRNEWIEMEGAQGHLYTQTLHQQENARAKLAEDQRRVQDEFRARTQEILDRGISH